MHVAGMDLWAENLKGGNFGKFLRNGTLSFTNIFGLIALKAHDLIGNGTKLSNKEEEKMRTLLVAFKKIAIINVLNVVRVSLF